LFYASRGCFFYVFDSHTDQVEPVCCSSFELLAENKVPPQPQSIYTAEMQITVPAGRDQNKRLCYCVNHTVPVDFDTAPEYMTAGEFHFGKEGTETESLILHKYPEPFDSPINDCWDYQSDGGCLGGILGGHYYTNIYTNTTLTTGLLRAQVVCVGQLFDLEGA